MQRSLIAVAVSVTALAVLPGGLFAVDLDERLDRVLKRVLEGSSPHYDQDLVVADLVPRPVRRFTNFSGDLSGRYIGAVSAAAAHREIPAGALRELVRRALEYQRADGSFGGEWSGSAVTDDAMAKVWGNGRLLAGLLDYHDHSGDPAALRAASKLGDFILSLSPVFHDSDVEEEYSRDRRALGYVCWTQNIEGLAALSLHTGRARYLEGAREIALRVRRLPRQHSHGFLTSLRGMLEIYRQDDSDRWLRSVETAWFGVSESPHLSMTGSVAEYFEAEPGRDEGCSIADWLLLSLELWDLTGDPRYIEAAERTWFNGFAANQFASGDFGHVYWSPTGYGFGGERAWWCCTLHALRTIPEVAEAAFRFDGATLLYDLAVDGNVESQDLAVRASADLRGRSAAALRIRSSAGDARTIGVRQPSWSDDIVLALNGRPIESRRAGGYVFVRRQWSAGDELAVEYSMRTEVVPRNTRADYRAAKFGPWILGIAEESESAFFGEGFDGNLADWDRLTEAEPTNDVLSVGYIHAGYKEQTEVARLLPIAERGSGSGIGRWQVWMLGTGNADRYDAVLSRLRERARRLPLSGLAIGCAVFAAVFLAWLATRNTRSRGGLGPR